MINGQGLGAVAGIKYGLFPVGFNGCEVIAVFNALEYIGIGRDFCEVLRYMEKYALLFGLFGCNPFRIGDALSHFGAEYEKADVAEGSRIFIISSWTGRPFLSEIHTVFCVRLGDGIIKVYNRFNGCPDCVYYTSWRDIFKNRKTIVIYNIKKEVKK